MNKWIRNALTKTLITLIGTLPLLTACGGGDEGSDVMTLSDVGSNSSNANSGQGNDCNLFFLLFSLGTLCVDDGGSQPSQPPAGSSSGSTGGSSSGSGNSGSGEGSSSTGGTQAVRVNRFTEYEPNSSLDNANPVHFLPVSGDTLAGLDITGNVQEATDASDFFVFTPNRSGDYLVYLCADTCGEQVVDDAVHLMVYDQSQTTIAGTPIGVVEEQMFSVHLTAGLAYYVEVHIYDFAGMTYDYRLVVIE